MNHLQEIEQNRNTRNFRTISLKASEEKVDIMTLAGTKRFIVNYVANHLPDKLYHKDTLKDYRGVPYIQSVCGSALAVINNFGKTPSEKVMAKADKILAHVKNYGHTAYTEKEVMVVYAYRKLYREIRLSM